tara:strand:+ start:369 stop:563 length:195 start_codon:yes stop_codon:yes gene_type:complete
MMGRKQKLKGGDEYDVLGGWRRWHCYLQRAGAVKTIKKKMNRRDRHDAKLKLHTREDKFKQDFH